MHTSVLRGAKSNAGTGVKPPRSKDAVLGAASATALRLERGAEWEEGLMMCSESVTEKARSQDPRSTAELIQVALGDIEENDTWDAISVLWWRGTREVFDAARVLCESAVAHEQATGATILAQMGSQEHPFPDETRELLLPMLESATDTEVLSSVICALGHLHDARLIEPVTRFKTHADPDVRWHVVLAIDGFEDDLAIHTLIEISSDESPLVRDWATFALGSLIDTDSECIRDALFQRLSDEDADTRGEALKGLAYRGDERALQPIIQELLSGAEDVGLAVEAAEALGDPRLYPALLTVRRQWEGDPEYIDAALERCKPGGRPGA
jgi:HEAT repeat protein